jgi:hypothetical protein
MDEKEDVVYGSMDEILAAGSQDTEYASVDGFKPGEKVRIGSVTAGDMIEWSEASEGEAKRTAGLRLLCKSLVGPEKPPKGKPVEGFIPNHRYADDKKNIPKFRGMRHKETERIVKEILKLNGMTVKAEAEAKKD